MFATDRQLSTPDPSGFRVQRQGAVCAVAMVGQFLLVAKEGLRAAGWARSVHVLSSHAKPDVTNESMIKRTAVHIPRYTSRHAQ